MSDSILSWLLSDRPDDLADSEWLIRSHEALALIVEDHEDTRLLLRLALEAEGFAVAECRDGLKAVDLIDRLRPEVVLLDGRLPSCDGWTVCHRIRNSIEDIRDTPIIFITATEGPVAEQRAFEAGCTLFFLKPFDIYSLVSAATELVMRRSPTYRARRPH
jgi:CheY-like chemotaxis protein